MHIKTARDFGSALAQGRYTSLGSYPTFFLCSDGGCLSFVDAWENRAQIVNAINTQDNSGWRVVAFDVNWEDPELYSDDSGERIESAYAEDGACGEPQDAPESYRAWLTRTSGRQVARMRAQATNR
jgi:hypothetical protein